MLGEEENIKSVKLKKNFNIINITIKDITLANTRLLESSFNFSVDVKKKGSYTVISIHNDAMDFDSVFEDLSHFTFLYRHERALFDS